MQSASHEKHIITKQNLAFEDAAQIRALQAYCEKLDGIALKLELDYKLADAKASQAEGASLEINEFLYREDQELIGYLGICGFGGRNDLLEITGMVHPQHRCKGVFKALSDLAMAECRRRNAKSVLGLCDRNAILGQTMITKKKYLRHHSEYEMILRNGNHSPTDLKLRGISLRKAKNADAQEIARQDKIYFGEEFNMDDADAKGERLCLPEDEEKRGFTIYLAVRDSEIIGKVNLQLLQGVGGIFGLGVLPKERGNGYGRAILLLAVQKLLEAGAQTVYLQVLSDNEKALSLYQSSGFETSSVMDYFTLIP